MIAGGVLMPLLWTGLCHSFMGIINPPLQRHVDWFWFIVSQAVYGLAMSIVVVRSQKVYIPPAGSGPICAVRFTGFRPGRRSPVSSPRHRTRRLCPGFASPWRPLSRFCCSASSGCDLPGRPKAVRSIAGSAE